jgi:hypothetical protein
MRSELQEAIELGVGLVILSTDQGMFVLFEVVVDSL